MKSLKDLGLNGTGEIAHVAGRGPLTQRLLAMGFLPGTRLRVVQIAPFGDPITVELDGWRVSLRLREAEWLQLKPTNGNGNGKGHP
ncbi:MAG: ferrous iron transport protein A [Planctomycetes bacterium]|nr:ferrous iron transport protein A [Planctomycetota bacterium]